MTFTLAWFQSYEFLPVGTPRNPCVSVDNEEAVHHRIVDACQSLCSYPASLNGCGVPWWDVSRRALNLMEDILSTYHKCTLTAITKLNVYGLMLIWIFFVVLVCGTSAQVSAPVSYGMYICLTWRRISDERWKCEEKWRYKELLKYIG
jgi:hypothetical protein